MNNDGLYHQPRWVNAIVIAGCVPVILSQYVMPKGLSQAFVLLAVPLLFLFVGVCNRVRWGAFFPRWAERKRIAERLDSENTRRISEAELAVIEKEVLARRYQAAKPSSSVQSRSTYSGQTGDHRS